jgi:hypothetical protein
MLMLRAGLKHAFIQVNEVNRCLQRARRQAIRPAKGKKIESQKQSSHRGTPLLAQVSGKTGAPGNRQSDCRRLWGDRDIYLQADDGTPLEGWYI